MRGDRGDVDLTLERSELLGEETLTPRTVNEPLKSGQSALDEAERAAHADGADDVPDVHHLAEYAVDELRAVAAADELLGAGPEQPAFDLQSGPLVPVARRIDDPDAGAGDDDVVDVRAGPGMLRSWSTTRCSEAMASSA